MNKSEFVSRIAERADITKAEAERFLDATLESINSALQSGEEIRLLGFGTFLVTDQKERQARNPQTGAVISIKAKKLPKFRPGKQLKDAVDGNKA